MKKIFCVGIISMLSLSIIGCSNENAATVNGTDITKDKYEKTMEIVYATANYRDKQYIEEIEKSLGEKYKSNIENIILSFMIDNELLYQEGKDKNFIPSDEEVKLKYEEVNTAINSNPKYKKIIDEIGIDEEYLLEEISKDMTIQNYKKDFESNITIDEKEILDYYENNKSKFSVNEVEASHILVSTLDKNKKEVGNEEKEKLKKKAEDILARINSGEDFEKLAKEYSDDKDTGKNGGNLGYFSKTDKNIEFTDEAFRLENGDISPVVETSYGYHIIKVTDKKNVSKSFNESKNKVKEFIIKEKYINHIEELSKKADIKR